MPPDKDPTLSVLMPVFNAEKCIAKAIESILGQSFRDFELIISDDGSVDRSKEIINSYALRDKRILISHNDENEGKVKTVNRIYELAKGQFITIHDADDFSLKLRFEKQLKKLGDGSGVDFCGTNFLTVSKNFAQQSFLVCDTNKLADHLEHESQIHGPTLIFRRTLLKGDIYRSFFDGYGEDYDLVLRLLDHGSPANLKECLYLYYKGVDSLSLSLTPKKIFSHDLARFLYQQRKISGIDWLMEGKQNELEARLYFLSKKYRDDKSLIHRRQAELYMYYGYKNRAIIESLKAIQANPLKFKNFRLLQYCIRKKLLNW